MDNQKRKERPPRLRWLMRLLIFALASPFLCVGGYMIYLLGFDMYGTAIDSITHYPNSEMIWSGYGVYGSGDFGTKIYYRWTDDDLDAVTEHYENFPESWQSTIISVAEIDFERLSVCNWLGFTSGTNGCQVIKQNLPDYGILIVFSHSYFAG